MQHTAGLDSRGRIKPPRTWLRSVSSIQADIGEIVRALRRDADLALKLGCGDHPIPGVVNCDLHSDKADVAANIASLPQFADGSVSLIETHHAIEHLSLNEVRPALAEWHRLLRPGGHLVITCPDLDAIAKTWLAGRTGFESYSMKMIYGSQEHAGMYHRSGYNGRILSGLLQSSGFAVIFTFTPYPSRPTPSLLVIAARG
jgi:SAM-dependent methyltransferase